MRQITRAVFAGDPQAVSHAVAADPSIGGIQDESFNDTTPLHVAVGENEEALALLLIEACPAALQVPDVEQRLPVHHLCTFTSVHLLTKLIVDVNVRDKSGRTPLHYACEVMSVECAEALLAAGADPTIEDEDG